MSHDEEETVEGRGFGDPIGDEELLEPLDNDFGLDDEEEQDKN